MRTDYERLAHAQDALRAPIDASDPEPWVRVATAAVRDVAACDHTLFFLPSPPGYPITPPGRPPLVWSSDTDPAVPTAYEAALTGGGMGQEWSDPLLDKARRVRQQTGGVFHERDLTSREAVEVSGFYREVLHPHGIRHLMGLAVDGSDGQEYAVVVAYERSDAPGFCEETLLRLRLLHPAFEASVRTRTRPHAEMEVREAAFAATVDALDLAVLVVAPDGRDLHWNGALDRLLEDEPETHRVFASVRAWARDLFQSSQHRDEWSSKRRDRRPAPLVALPCIVRTQRRDYRVGGVQLGPILLGREAVLVTVERIGLPLPETSTLSERFGLTRREAEVALHLARGQTDRQIAAALTISYSTARRHAERTLQKLEVQGRAAVAARVCEPPDERQRGD